MKMLVAVDGSPYTKHMLAYLAAHDEWLGNKKHDFTVVHVVPAVPPRAAAVFAKDTLDAYYHDECEAVFEPIRAFFKQLGIDAQFVTKVGHAADLVAKMADDGKYDLLVMGSHGHGSLSNLVMGSVTTKVIAHCRTPVLLVR
jgi:nucleotide-binding universal stress UspA family protein